MLELRSRRPGRSTARASRIVATTAAACLCAGQLIATSPARAAAAEAVSRPAIAASNSRPKLPWGSAATLRITVTDPKTGKPAGAGTAVALEQWSASSGSWRARGTKTLYANGYNWFSVKPLATTSYRIVFKGGGGYARYWSPTMRVTVTPSGAKVLAEAKRHVGKPYRYAASGPSAFDCSGYTMYVYRKAAGKKLPHKANSQQRYGRAVSKSAARPGDLIVIRSGSYGTHAGVYAGGGYMYDSPHAGSRVGKHKIWSRNYVVRRLV
ncbi:NlpC/P60 family protein [Asanoa hainanensis]|uniref:NlpC/P60 family protein n=1 Tax=Asanoa hainanensis TaxID=560556 RepID=A0A239NDY4_9ACTN|nr:C40 family peptidase [Asanoa hainanensis]SNT53106.1 NlpC/P60 family protein [Asanoa hainanensis]